MSIFLKVQIRIGLFGGCFERGTLRHKSWSHRLCYLRENSGRNCFGSWKRMKLEQNVWVMKITWKPLQKRWKEYKSTQGGVIVLFSLQWNFQNKLYRILRALLSFFGIFKSKLQRKECTMVEYVGGQKRQKEKEERCLSIFPSIPN